MPTKEPISTTNHDWVNGPQNGTACVAVSICRYVKSNLLRIFVGICIHFCRLSGVEWNILTCLVSKRARYCFPNFYIKSRSDTLFHFSLI